MSADGLFAARLIVRLDGLFSFRGSNHKQPLPAGGTKTPYQNPSLRYEKVSETMF